MTVWVANAHAHIQRLVLVVKMATMLEAYNTEEQRSVVRISWQKDLMQRISIKKCFLFRVGSVCRAKPFRAGSRNSLMDLRKSQMMKRSCVSDWGNCQKILCCGFLRVGKEMKQVYRWWKICREVIFFFQFRISHILRFIFICDLFTDSHVCSFESEQALLLNESLKGKKRNNIQNICRARYESNG
jgi:hypothetical protein